MFQQLRNNIVRYVLLVTCLFTLIISLVSVGLVGRGTFTAFRTSAINAIAQSVDNSTLSVEAAQAAAVQIFRSSTVLQALHTEQYNPAVNPLLNTLKNASFGIMGITLYAPDHTYTTSSISAVPTLAEMATEPGIGAFIASMDDSFLSLRTSHMARLYNHVRYDPSYGVLSYIVRLPDHRGFLFMDLNPRFFYDNFFDYDPYPSLRETKTYIVTDRGSYLQSRLNAATHALYLNEAVSGTTTVSYDGRYLIVAVPFVTPDSQVVSLVPLKPVYYHMLRFGLVLMLMAGLSVATAWFVAQKLADYMITPLSRLRTKMRRWNA